MKSLILISTLTTIISSPINRICYNTCKWHSDGECDDGGPNSLYTVCHFGTDCNDCGPRLLYTQYPPPTEPPTEPSPPPTEPPIEPPNPPPTEPSPPPTEPSPSPPPNEPSPSSPPNEPPTEPSPPPNEPPNPPTIEPSPSPPPPNEPSPPSSTNETFFRPANNTNNQTEQTNYTSYNYSYDRDFYSGEFNGDNDTGSLDFLQELAFNESTCVSFMNYCLDNNNCYNNMSLVIYNFVDSGE